MIEVLSEMLSRFRRKPEEPSGYIPSCKEWETYVNLHRNTLLQPVKVNVGLNTHQTIEERIQIYTDELLEKRRIKGLGKYSEDKWRELYKDVALVTIAEVRMVMNSDAQNAFLQKLGANLPHFCKNNPNSVGVVAYPEIPYI